MDRKEDAPCDSTQSEPRKSQQKRPYIPPKALRLEPSAALRELAARARPSDPEARHLLTRLSQHMEELETHTPSLSLEIRMPRPGETSVAVLKLHAEQLTVQHL